MDIALVLSKIRPNAKWRMADTYAHLQKTWEDEEQVIPTIEELETAWNEILEEQSKSKEYEKIDQNILDTNEAIAAMHERLLKLEGGK